MAEAHRNVKVSSFALAKAVDSERTAIEAHEAAAHRLDQLASELERHALTDRNERLRKQRMETAAKARQHAQSARERAAAARQRLREEGFDPER